MSWAARLILGFPRLAARQSHLPVYAQTVHVQTFALLFLLNVPSHSWPARVPRASVTTRKLIALSQARTTLDEDTYCQRKEKKVHVALGETSSERWRFGNLLRVVVQKLAIFKSMIFKIRTSLDISPTWGKK